TWSSSSCTSRTAASSKAPSPPSSATPSRRGSTPKTPTATSPPPPAASRGWPCPRSEEHTSELQSRFDLVCRLLLEKKKNTYQSVKIHKLSYNRFIVRVQRERNNVQCDAAGM